MDYVTRIMVEDAQTVVTPCITVDFILMICDTLVLSEVTVSRADCSSLSDEMPYKEIPNLTISNWA